VILKGTEYRRRAEHHQSDAQCAREPMTAMYPGGGDTRRGDQGKEQTESRDHEPQGDYCEPGPYPGEQRSLCSKVDSGIGQFNCPS